MLSSFVGNIGLFCQMYIQFKSMEVSREVGEQVFMTKTKELAFPSIPIEELKAWLKNSNNSREVLTKRGKLYRAENVGNRTTNL